MTADVAIVGGGPAGSIAALGLARAGFRTVLIEPRTDTAPRIGEVLSGAGGSILRDLGLWDRFATQEHGPSHAVLSCWENPDPYARSMVFDPWGSGWHLDRGRFDGMLLDAAVEAGACVMGGRRAVSADFDTGLWDISLEANGPDGSRDRLSVRILIDATGRGAPISRSLGAERIRSDNMVALAHRYESESCDATGRRMPANMVEAVPGGWWYSAPLPQGELLAVFMTDADLLARSPRPLAVPEHTAARIGTGRLGNPPRVWSAVSGLTRRASGDIRPWLAAGDAAAAFDPLAGQGICFALRSGQYAALAARGILDGDWSALAAYEKHIEAVFEAYLTERRGQYDRVSRFRDHAFWQRRQSASPGTGFAAMKAVTAGMDGPTGAGGGGRTESAGEKKSDPVSRIRFSDGGIAVTRIPFRA